MQLIFVDRDPVICAVLRSVMPFAEVRNCDLAAIPKEDFDVVMTPGNSFGFMDGGFDLAVRNYFPFVELEIQKNIKRYYQGQLAVGQAFAVHAGEPLKFVAYAPTMRVPEPIVNTDNVYWAFRAGLLAVRALIETKQIPPYRGARVLSSAFGTAAGQVSAGSAAHAMRLAYEHAMRTPEQIEQAHTWRGAYDDHAKIRACR